MDNTVDRRRFLKLASAAAAGAGGLQLAQPRAAAAADKDKTMGLLGYQDGPQVWVRFGNHVRTSYRAHPTQKYPYWYPLVGPLSGRSLRPCDEITVPSHLFRLGRMV